MPHHAARLLAVVLAVILASPVGAGDHPWTEVPERERQMLARLLDSSHWPFRVFALTRLERYSGDELALLIRERVGDEAPVVSP